MPGRSRRFLPALLALAALAGCDAFPPPPDPADTERPDPAPSTGTLFDPRDAGTVTGCVCWAGDDPLVPPFRSPASPLSAGPRGPARNWPNPHAPAIDSSTHGLGEAVVFLRGIDPRRAAPWSHSPVRIEAEGLSFSVRQGDRRSRVGFVRRGDEVAFVSRQDDFEALQLRGAVFCGIPLPHGDQVVTRRVRQAGAVEVSSSAGHFWARAHLFVTDHPYYTRTDNHGLFTLPSVPAGEYELVCWHPDWRVAERELDADTGLMSRVVFRPPLEQVHAVRVEPGRSLEVSFTLSADR